MRLWSLHPKHLDARGLVALWREALLAQAVLRGRTQGYRHHPQLVRFRAQSSPVDSIAEYLEAVHAESVRRGYRFDAGRIAHGGTAERPGRIDVPRGQVDFEWDHLAGKLEARAPEWLEAQRTASRQVHPLFRLASPTGNGQAGSGAVAGAGAGTGPGEKWRVGSAGGFHPLTHPRD